MEKITVNSMQHYLEEAWNAFLEQFPEKQMKWPNTFSQRDSVVYCSTPDGEVPIFGLEDLAERAMNISVFPEGILFDFHGGQYSTLVKYEKNAETKYLEVVEISKTNYFYRKSRVL